MGQDDLRPDPDAVLAQTNEAPRGKLRIFLGMAPGVGKTYAMLAEAHQRKKAGLDILIGWVDTHKRKDTEALTRGLEILPRKKVEHGGITVGTLDIDEILRRKPSVVVIDEMPHSNPPGSRHAKRWQDIEELLDMGISVWTALNIQHLESLNGVVARVTGVSVTETVPDRMFDRAAEVRLIDLPPDDLLARLAAGKIYLPKVVERAKDAYFKKSNLIALRELALRAMANRMESQIRSERMRSTRRSVEDTHYGLLLVLESRSEKAVREVARMARDLSSPWHVVWMDGMGNERSESEAVTKFFDFVEALGGRTDVLAGRYGDTVARYAREYNLSLVTIVAANERTANARRRDLHCAAPELNVLVLAQSEAPERRSLRRWWSSVDLGRPGLWQAAVAALAAAVVLTPFWDVMEPTNQAMIYLLSVLYCGVRYGSLSAAMAAIFSVMIFNLTAVEPRWSFAVSDAQFVVTFAVMLIVGLVAGQLVAHREDLAKAANEREHQTRLLFDASRELSQVLVEADVFKVIAGTLRHNLAVEAEFWLPENDPQPGLDEEEAAVTLERWEMVLKNVDAGIVRWTYDHRRPAGSGTHTLASSPYWYIPMMAGGEVLGVMVLSPRDGKSFDTTTRRLIGTLAGLGAQTLLRIGFAVEARQTLISMESERLRHGLIQSLSNDLRTPISLLKKASEGFLEKLERTGASADIVADAEKLFDGTSRMERLAINLQDMARLQAADFEIRRSPVAVKTLFDESIAEMGDRLEGFSVEWNVEEECPAIEGDPDLLRRVIVNLLDNAVKFCPEGSRIILGGRKRGQRVAVTVSDNGPGLPEGNPQRLFDPFRRGQGAGGGVGLGLAVCRTIARAHDAEIFAMPSRFGGAAFTLTLPIYEPKETEEDEASEKTEKGDKTVKKAGAEATSSEAALPHPDDAHADT